MSTSLLSTSGISGRPKYHLAALASWLGPIAVGTVVGYTSPAIPSIEMSHIQLSDDQATWFASLMALGGLLGGIIAGPSIEKCGRKGTVMMTCIPFIAGWLLITYATGCQMLFIGRIMTGFASGLISLSVPVYIAETATPETRGFFGSGFQFAVTIGVVLVYVAGKYLAWSWLALHCALYPVILLILMCFMPETPTWLAKRGRYADATEAMLFLYGEDQPLINQTDYQTVDESETTSGWREFTKKEVYVPLLISMALMFFQQFSGINAIMFYTVQIFRSSGTAIDPNNASIIVGIVQVAATFAACVLMDRAGRRVLLLLSSTIMTLSLGLLSLYYYLDQEIGQTFHDSFNWLPLFSLVVFVAAFSIGFGPIPWLLMGEILPGKVKGLASGISTTFNWTCAFILTKEFADIISVLHQEGAYLLMASICAVGGIFVALKVPETKGSTLQEIESYFRGGDTIY